MPIPLYTPLSDAWVFQGSTSLPTLVNCSFQVGKQWISLWVSFVLLLLLGNQAAFHTYIGHLDFLVCKWLVKSFANFPIGSSVFLLVICRICKKHSSFKPCVGFICSRYLFPICVFFFFFHSVHQSIYLVLHQNHSRQTYLNNYWLRLCSLGIRRLKVRYSQISKDLENQRKGLDLTQGAKEFPSMSGSMRERFWISVLGR